MNGHVLFAHGNVLEAVGKQFAENATSKWGKTAIHGVWTAIRKISIHEHNIPLMAFFGTFWAAN